LVLHVWCSGNSFCQIFERGKQFVSQKGARLDTATNKVASFRKERRIYPAGHSITRARCRMNAAFHRGVQFAPE
jgi:hypothetical protein